MQNLILEHAQLCRTICLHNKLYYSIGQTSESISDHDYDLLFRSLQKLEEEHPELCTRLSPTQTVGYSAKQEEHWVQMVLKANLKIEPMSIDEAIRSAEQELALSGEQKPTKISLWYSAVAALVEHAKNSRDSTLEEVALMLEGKRDSYRTPEFSYPNGCLNSVVIAQMHVDDVRNMKSSADEEK